VPQSPCRRGMASPRGGCSVVLSLAGQCPAITSALPAFIYHSFFPMPNRPLSIPSFQVFAFPPQCPDLSFFRASPSFLTRSPLPRSSWVPAGPSATGRVHHIGAASALALIMTIHLSQQTTTSAYYVKKIIIFRLLRPNAMSTNLLHTTVWLEGGGLQVTADGTGIRVPRGALVRALADSTAMDRGLSGAGLGRLLVHDRAGCWPALAGAIADGAR